LKNIIKILAALAAALVLLGNVSPAGAVTTGLQLVGDSSGLVLVPAGEKLFDLGNMAPGDTCTATINIKNSYSRWYDLWIRAEDLEDSDPSLLNIMELTVSFRGKPLYEGTVADFPPVPGSPGSNLSLGRFRPGESGALVATVHLPGPETGDEFQGKTAGVKWVFTAQSRSGGGGGGGGGGGIWEPEPPGVPPQEEPPGTPPEEELVLEPERPGVKPVMPRTGEGAPYFYYLLGGLALLAGMQLARKPKRR